MSQQSDQWDPWPREKQQAERHGPLKAVHPFNQSQHELAEKKEELEKEKKELAKKNGELERENKALQEAKDKLEEKEKEVIDLKQKVSSNKAIFEKRLKDKDKELEAKQQLERELVAAKVEVKLVKERFEMTKIEKLKKQLEEERNDKVEQLKQKDSKIKRLEEQLFEKQKQLSEKEKYIFDMEASIAADQKERERLNKEKEEKEKESDKNIADAARRIDELERQQQEQLQVIKNLTEENERLRVGGSELTRELNEKDTKLEEWHIKVTKLEEEMEYIRIVEGEKRTELGNKFRREQEDLKRETQRLINTQQEAAKAKYSGRIKEWQAKLKQVEEENKKLEERLSEKEAERMSLSDNLTTKDGEILKLKEQLHDQGQENAILKKSLDEKNLTTIALEKEVRKIMKFSTEKEERIKGLVERLQLKETENALFKQDFETERNDRERIHTQLTDLKGKYELLKQELVEKEQILAEAQKKFHNFQQSHSTTEHDLENSKKDQAMVTTLQQQLQRMREESAKIKEESVRMKQSNKVLMEKVVASKTQKEEVASLRRILSEFQSSWKASRYDVNLSGKELGRGGWGVVWVGQMRVAVKQIHHSIKSDTNLELLRQEINTMSQIRHPNLVHFIGAVFDGDSPDMIITEVMDTSLRNAYETKKLTPDRPCRPVILSIMHDVAVGLSYLHCLPKPIIHRDVSSGNVLLQSIGPGRWRAKISDFGSAKIAQFAVTKGPGAFSYSAPEAFQSIMNPDAITKQTPKMDVFSYGVLLCEAITCCFPDRDDFQDMLRQVYCISDIPRGSRTTQGYLLHALILSSCDDDPSKRPTMNEVIEQLGIIAM